MLISETLSVIMMLLPSFTVKPVVSALFKVTSPFLISNVNSDSTLAKPLGAAVSLRTYSPSSRLAISTVPPLKEMVFLSDERIAVLSLRSSLLSELLGAQNTVISEISFSPLSQRRINPVPSSSSTV